MTVINCVIHNRAEKLEAADNKAVMKLQGGAETVLIVEDEESILNLSKEMLEMLGYKVLAVNETDQALRLAREYNGNIDLLLTDVMMPGMNGKELSDRIIAFKPGLKRLYMSGYTSDVIARQGILEEDIQFIPKPFSFTDLASKVRETLGQ
jgi:two-component system cell cycle sensor histidine kinase/response regulator CckA